MARTMWKGAISFGLLHAPVALYPASRQDEVDFDWLRQGTLQPVGYKRVVKETGEEVGKDDIIKGVKYEGRYVILSDDEIRAANPKSTHTVDILGFTGADEVNFLFYETPYYLAPTKGGEKVYALLREAMIKAQKIAVAQVVLHNKQHLAALIATPRALVLNTLRWATEVRDEEDLDLPEAGLKGADIKPKEVQMATQLIESMTEDWAPAQYRNTFRDDIMALVKKKYDAGQAEEITEVSIEEQEDSNNVVDLTELLRQSLQGKAGRAPRKEAVPKKTAPPPRKTATRASKSVH